MTTENVADIASFNEASSSSSSSSSQSSTIVDFSTENDKCSCALDASEICMHCAVKEYQEALQKARDYSIKCNMPRTKDVKRRKRNHKLHFENENYISDSEQDDFCNKNLQFSENSSSEMHCETDDSRFDKETDSISDTGQNNLISFHLSQDYQIDFKQHAGVSTDVIPLSQNLPDFHENTRELAETSVDMQEDQDDKPNILLDVKIEPYNSDSESTECQDTSADFQLDQNHPSDSPVPNILNIRSITCNMDSDSKDTQDCHEYSQLGNELHIKSEPCDIDSNSDPFMSDSSKETKVRSESFESSNEGRDIDHSNNSLMVHVKNENPDSENRIVSPPNQDLKRSRRNSKRKREMEDHCPVCGVTIRYADLENHFAKEVENLSNIPKNLRKNRASHKEGEDYGCGLKRDFVQTKMNRENRIVEQMKKCVKKRVIRCPVCKISLWGTDEENNDHVLNCFGENDDSDINVTDFDENFEEYEIGDETRVRVISLVPGGHSALHGYSSKSKNTNEEDDGADINVDVDDTLSFGKPQYTELDVIHNTNSASNEKEEQLRRAVVSDPSAEPHVIEGKKWSRDSDIQNDIDEIIGSCMKNKPKKEKLKENEEENMKIEDDSKKEENVQNTESEIISSLKERIKDLEQQKNVKCLICLEPYTRPVVSTTCWHVHCEECWLVSMGVKKLCPQCNMIVFPTDLRRIYL